MDIYCKVTAHGLVPLYDSDHDNKTKLKEGRIVRCRISLPRNLHHHKKFFALLRLVFDNLPEPLIKQWNIHTEADMLRRVKRDLGMYDSHTNDKGEREIEYHSISFAAMEQTAFNEFYNECLNLVTNSYLKGTNKEQIIEEIQHYF